MGPIFKIQEAEEEWCLGRYTFYEAAVTKQTTLRNNSEVRRSRVF
jgi:hypothetical protein